MLFHKIVSSMANRADPDPLGAAYPESVLFAEAILSESFLYSILGHIPY